MADRVRGVGAPLASFVLALLSACGGGGGGGDGGGIQVNLGAHEIAMTGLAGTPLSATLTATVSGDTSQPVYVGATADRPGIASVQIGLLDRTAILNVHADSTLAAGVYSGTLTVVACADQQCHQHVGGSPFRLPFTVTYHSRLAQPAQQVIAALATTVAADLRGSVRVSLAQSSGPVITWTAATDATWLKLDTTAGSTGESLTYHVEVAEVAGQENGTDRAATVTVTPDLSIVPAVQFTVTLRKRLPEVRYVAPGVRLAGQASRVYVRGVGYDALSMTGLAPLSGIDGVTVTRNSDTELQLEVPASPVGTYPVALTNALGLPAASSALRIVNPLDLPAAVIEEAGEKTTLLHDFGAQALYLVEDSSIVRLAWRDGAWSRTSQPLADLVDVALSPDGSELVAVTDPRTVRVLDPVTMVEESAYASAEVIYLSQTGTGAPVTGDGRVWMGLGGTFSTLGAFDLARRTFEKADMSQVGNGIYNGPYCFTGNDGERLLVVQSGSVSPQPPLLYLESRDSVLKLAPAGPDLFYQASLGDDGRRMFLSGRYVLDGDFATVGEVALPSGWLLTNSVLSPDGNVAYVLSYPEYFSSASAPLPRIYAFDASGPVVGSLPSLGYIELTAWPSCRTSGQFACYRGKLQISMDGRTLFVAGGERLLVTPVPQSLRSQ